MVSYIFLDIPILQTYYETLRTTSSIVCSTKRRFSCFNGFKSRKHSFSFKI